MAKFGKTAMVKSIQSTCRVDKHTAVTMYDTMMENIKTQLKKGNSVDLGGIGTLRVVITKATSGTTPQGKRWSKPAGKTVRFRKSSSLKV